MGLATADQIELQYFERNIIFSNHRALAIYKIPLLPYAYKNKEQKRQLLGTLEKLLWIYRGKGQFLLLTKQLSKEELMNQLDDLQSENRFRNLYREWNQDVEKRFVERRPWEKELYVVFHLPMTRYANNEIEFENIRDFQHVLKWGYRQAGDAVMNFLKQSKDIEMERFLEAVRQERNLYNSLKSTVNILKATPREIEWLHRRGFFRSLGEPDLFIQEKMPIAMIEKNGNTYLRPEKHAVLSLFDDAVTQEKLMSVAFHHGEPNEKGKSSYQSFLALVDAPEDIAPVGGEWIYWLFAQDFPVDVSIRFDINDPQDEQRELSRKRKELKGDMDTKRGDGQEVSDMDYETMDIGRKLERKFSKGMPLIKIETILAVAGSNVREMEERVKTIQSFYAPRFYKFSRLRGNVLEGFKAFIPGGDMNPHWEIPSDPGFLSSSGIHCNNAIGDPAGPYLGDTAQGFPVLYDIGRPMRKPLDRAGTIIILGTLGGGKSVLKKKLVMQTLLMGGRVFSVDPKGEDHVFAEFPEIKDNMKVLKFQAGETTELPVFRLSNNTDRAWQIAKDFLLYLLNGTRNEERGYVITKAVEETMFSDKKTMFVFKEKMEQMIHDLDSDVAREAKRCLKLIEQYEKDPMARVIFTEKEEDLALSDYPLVVASLKGLSLPKRVKKGKEGEGIKAENMTDSEKISVGIMYLVAALGREMLMNKPCNQVGMFVADEAWMLTQIKQGEDLIQDIVKLGRSMNIVPVLATQEGSDVDGPDIRNNVGVVFVFRMNAPEEIDGALSLLRITEKGEGMYQRFRELQSGHCFYRDIEGRVNKLQIYVPKDWMKVFDTSVKEPNGKKKVGVTTDEE